MRARHVLPCALAALAAAGCGGSSERAATAPPAPRAQPGVPPALALPRSVPRRPDGSPVDPGDAAVIRRWARTLARGDERGAARLFALPSRFQNGTPVLEVRTRPERLAVQASLSCGARVTGLRGAGAYVVVRFALQGRPGGEPSCSGDASSVLRVQDGRITEWYRLFELDPSTLGDPV
jgi:hypothetical protein